MMTPRILPNATPHARGAVILNSRPATMVHDLPSIAKLVPNARIMFALREPASRAISHLSWHRTKLNLAPLPPQELNEKLVGFMRIIWSKSLCLARGATVNSGLNAMFAAAMLDTSVALPACMTRTVIPCERIMRAADIGRQPPPRGTHAVLPFDSINTPEIGLILSSFYLRPIMRAQELFGFKSVHVHWLDTFVQHTPEVLSSITSFIGVPPLENPPAGEAELWKSYKDFRAVTEKQDDLLPNPTPNNEAATPSSPPVIGELSTVFEWELANARRPAIDPASQQLRRLQLFFEPFERVRRAYFAIMGMPEQLAVNPEA
jgi:hypothetical protein